MVIFSKTALDDSQHSSSFITESWEDGKIAPPPSTDLQDVSF